MARAGSFGRRPRTNNNASNSAIASLLAQARAAEWSAMQDAWNNGGEVVDPTDPEGKRMVPATDEVILAYMEKRRAAISDATDPEYVQWANNISQLKFSIAESKIGVKFKEGKVTASQMASFYKGQLANLPKDSEIYRTVEGRAADWAKSVAAQGRANAASRVNAALQRKFDANTGTMNAFANMDADLVAAARRAGFLTDDRQGLGDIKPEDMAAWKHMLELGVPSADGKTVYHTADYQTGMTNYYNALGSNASLATQAGNASAAEKYTKAQGDFVTSHILPTNAMDLETQYAYARKKYDDAIEAANGNPAAEKAAQDAYKVDLKGLIDRVNAVGTDPTKGGVSPYFKTGLVNDLNAQDGKNTGPTWEDQTNAGAGGTTSDSDANLQSKNATQIAENNLAVSEGRAIYGQTSPGSPLGLIDASRVIEFTPDGPKLPDSYQVTTLADGTHVYYAGEPVFTTEGGSIKPAGFIFRNSAGAPVQYATITYGPDGQPVRDKKGNYVLAFTTTDPFHAVPTADANGKMVQVTTAVTPVTTTGPATGGAIAGNTNFISLGLGGGQTDTTPFGDRQKAQDWSPTQTSPTTGDTTQTPGIDMQRVNPGSPSPLVGMTMAKPGLTPAAESAPTSPVALAFGGSDGNPLGDRSKALPTPTITLPNMPNTFQNPLGDRANVPTAPTVAMPKPPTFNMPTPTDATTPFTTPNQRRAI